MDDEIVAYAFEPEDYQKLISIKDRLFGNGSQLTSDARRDLANLMSLIILDYVKTLTKKDLK